MDATRTAALEAFVARAAGAQRAQVRTLQPLSGGAVQENWLLDLHIEGGAFNGELHAVLRCDSPSAGVSVSLSRAHEFALLRVARAAGVTVPEALWLGDDATLIGRPFFIMRRVGGTAAAHVLVRQPRPGLAERLGAELARIHALRPPQPHLDFLPLPTGAPALHTLARHRAFLDALPRAYPALEWGLRWLQRRAPPRGDIVLCHRDFRTGNYMVDAQGLTAILDWEFAGWSDPLEDIGWFFARCWRFGADRLEAGGIGTREAFLHGYTAQCGRVVDPRAVHYWEVMAHLSWAVICIQQAARGVAEDALLLQLTGHIVPELEWEILAMTEND